MYHLSYTKLSRSADSKQTRPKRCQPLIIRHHVMTGMCRQSHEDQPRTAAGDQQHQEDRRRNLSFEEEAQSVRELLR